METHWIVKGFDVLEHRYFGVIEIFKALEFGPFVLQRPEESFSNRIIITAPSSFKNAGTVPGTPELNASGAGMLSVFTRRF